MGKSHESRGVSPRQRDCKRNVHDVALVGGSARIPIVQKMFQVGGLVFDTYRNRSCHRRDVKEQTSVPSRSGEVLMRSSGISNITLDVES